MIGNRENSEVGSILRRVVPGLVALAACAAGSSASAQDRPADYATTGAISTERAPYDPEQSRKAVESWKAETRRDPKGMIAWRELAGAYLALGRETGDIADAVRAEEAAKQSLIAHGRGNSLAAMRLARAVLAQHRFPEALKIAEMVATADPQGLRLVADIQLEMGDYAAASKALAAIPVESDDMNHKALRARFEEIEGRPDQALRLMREAAQMALLRPDLPAEVAAWYHTMVGHMLIDAGKLDEGEASCRKALEVFPRDYRAMTGLAEAANWRGDHVRTIEWAAKALAIAPQNPEALKLAADAHSALGREHEADEQYRALEVLAHSFPRIYDRHYVIYCADNGKNLDEALALARKDLDLRHDVHGYDALAWICAKKGLLPEADALMEKALAQGTQQAPLFHHAGVIAAALGDRKRADTYFQKARALNPYLMKAHDAASQPAKAN